MNVLCAAGLVAALDDKKIDDMKGIDAAKSKQLKMEKLESKIQELEQAIEYSKETCDAFNEHLVKEFAHFENLKTIDFENILMQHAENNLEFHEKSLFELKSILNDLEK